MSRRRFLDRPANPARALFLAGLVIALAGAGTAVILLRLRDPWERTDQPALIFAATAILTGIFWITALTKR